MSLVVEKLRDRWKWWRIAQSSWTNPLDPGFAKKAGGRWNPPNSFPVLYLNEDQVTARLNLRAFIADWPFEPEELRSEYGPVLIGANLPRNQHVCDVHTPEGVKAVGLPKTYPYEKNGALVDKTKCRPIGRKIKSEDLRGVRTRSARSRDGAGRELAWFPATARSVAKRTQRLRFDEWYWA